MRTAEASSVLRDTGCESIIIHRVPLLWNKGREAQEVEMLLTVVSFILVMGVIVFVHELGHFLVAKRNKIVVEEFGFGYPPRLVKLFERDGTIYSLNAIPFGGFCRMRGEDDPSQSGSFAAASRWRPYRNIGGRSRLELRAGDLPVRRDGHDAGRT